MDSCELMSNPVRDSFSMGARERCILLWVLESSASDGVVVLTEIDWHLISSDNFKNLEFLRTSFPSVNWM